MTKIEKIAALFEGLSPQTIARVVWRLRQRESDGYAAILAQAAARTVELKRKQGIM
jgi:hypothetical protein